jgi:3-keto-disaccharide hydrolase
VTPGTNDPIAQAAALPSLPFAGAGWEDLFDGHGLAGWKQTLFAGRGEVECRAGLMILNLGDPFTGVNWTNSFPTMNYEVAMDAMRVEGADFFCGLTVPVGQAFCSLIVGGWGGSLLGISSLDGMDASENETTKFMNFENGRWYRIRMRVTPDRLEAWVDAKKMVDVVTTGKTISLRPGDIELSKPFGLASWQTTAALRNIRLRRVTGPADPPPKRRF